MGVVQLIAHIDLVQLLLRCLIYAAAVFEKGVDLLLVLDQFQWAKTKIFFLKWDETTFRKSEVFS